MGRKWKKYCFKVGPYQQMKVLKYNTVMSLLNTPCVIVFATTWNEVTVVSSQRVKDFLQKIARGNSQHLTTPPLFYPQNDVYGTCAVIPY